MKVVRHVERDEQLKIGPPSSSIRVRDSCHLPVITPDIKGESVDAVRQSQRNILMTS